MEGGGKCPLVPMIASAAASAIVTAFIMKALCKGGSKQDDPKESREIYETQKSVLQYCEFHFTPGTEAFQMTKWRGHDMKISDAYDFPLRLGRLFDTYKPDNCGVALDLGCAVGASSFEMSKLFEKTIGIDLSEGFIQKAEQMRVNHELTFEAACQGDITVTRHAKLSAICPKARPEKCVFLVGDALNIDPKLGKFDAVLAANLVCRVPSPKALVQMFRDRINPGGVLVLASPYSWWTGACHQREWFGGTPEQGRSEEAVKKVLSGDFDLLHEDAFPFFLPDHHRRYQCGFSHLTVWRRKK